MSDNWPDLEYAEEITFEGRARLAIAPEEYEALLSSHADLQARLAECERAKDDHFMNSCLRANIEALAAENDTLRAQLAETQKLLEVQLAVGDKLTAEVARLKAYLEVDGDALKGKADTITVLRAELAALRAEHAQLQTAYKHACDALGR